MCGIAGVVALDGPDPPAGVAARMRDRIIHRGPDGNGEYDAPGASLAACRLAIVDLEPRGRMPMASPDGRLHVVHNGEIYNRLELRRELEQRGVSLRTTTDTEVLLHLYALEGEQMLNRLDGMFAFAIWDAGRGELFAARDRVGEKPFYYALHDGHLWFASEPKALFAGGVPCAFDESTWIELLTFRHVAGERTPYRGVRRLLPGHWLRARRGGVATDEWWRFATEGSPLDPRSFGPLFEESVRRRLIADVPVGTLLSGGLDSSSVTAVAAGLSDRRLPAFTVRYAGSPLDEGPFAAAAARAAGAEHHEIQFDPAELPALLAQTAWHLDEPMGHAASPEMLAISRYARQHVRVLLTGESADELFGGYGRLRMYRYPAIVRWGGRLLGPFSHRFRVGSRWHRAAAASRIDATDWVALTNADLDPASLTSAPMAEWAPFRARLAAAAASAHHEPVSRALVYERLTHLPAVLATGDRMTMGAPIEARLPFTDPLLLQLAARARPSDLFHGPHGKRPLREAMAGRLPEMVLERRKRGWTSPYRSYLRNVPELRDWLARVPNHDIVSTSPMGSDGVRLIVDGFLNGDDRAAGLAWMIGRVVLWHEVCVEGRRQPFDRAS